MPMTLPPRPPAPMAALMALALACLMPGAVLAEDMTFGLTMRGLPAGVLTISGNVDAGGAYQATGSLEYTGLLALVTSTKFTASASGTAANGLPRPTSYDENAALDEKRIKTQVTWDASGTPTAVTVTPPRDPRPYDIDPAAQKGTVDPLTALYTVLRDVPAASACNLALQSFDGRRLAAITVAAPQTDGDGLTCAGQYRRVAGYSDKDMADGATFDFTLRLKPADGGTMRVDSVALDTVYGKARLKRQ